MADETTPDNTPVDDDHIPGKEIDLSHDKVTQVDLQLEMQRSYLDYAMSVIVGRALPDVRDGLKPVHRRVIYAMYDGPKAGRAGDKARRSTIGKKLRVLVGFSP